MADGEGTYPPGVRRESLKAWDEFCETFGIGQFVLLSWVFVREGDMPIKDTCKLYELGELSICRCDRQNVRGRKIFGDLLEDIWDAQTKERVHDLS